MSDQVRGSGYEPGIPIRAKLQDSEDALMTRQVAARFLSITEKTLDRWAKNGHFKTYRLGGEVRFLKSELVGAWEAMQV
jgi:excisionase family DNA binding protein